MGVVAVRAPKTNGFSFYFGFTASGPVMPLPGCVEAGGSLAGKVASSSLVNRRSWSRFDFGARFWGEPIFGIASSSIGWTMST
jgi:hypothetical protein